MKIKDLLHQAICRFSNENNISVLTISNLGGIGVSKNNYLSYCLDLENDGLVEKISINGFYPTFKINEIIKCYSYTFDDNLPRTLKFFVGELHKQGITEYKPNKEIARLLNLDNATVSSKMFRLRKIVKNPFEYIKNIIEIDPEFPKNITITEGGGQIVNRKSMKENKPKKSSHIKRENCKNTADLLFRYSTSCSKQSNGRINHTLTKEEIQNQIDLQNNKCYYSGVVFNNITCIPSIDRVNSKLDYTKDNIVICDKRINIMKNKLNVTEFLNLVKIIHDANFFLAHAY